MLKYINPNFDGTMDRSEYALTIAAGFVFTIVLMIWSSIIINNFGVASVWWIHLSIYLYYTLLVMAATTKRARDCNKSSWWGVATTIPWFGFIFVIIFALIKSKKRYSNE